MCEITVHFNADLQKYVRLIHSHPQYSVSTDNTLHPCRELERADGAYQIFTKIPRAEDNGERFGWAGSRMEFPSGEKCTRRGCCSANNPTEWEQLPENYFRDREGNVFSFKSLRPQVVMGERTWSYWLRSPVSRFCALIFLSPCLLSSIFDFCCEGRAFLCPRFFSGWYRGCVGEQIHSVRGPKCKCRVLGWGMKSPGSLVWSREGATMGSVLLILPWVAASAESELYKRGNCCQRMSWGPRSEQASHKSMPI